MNQCHYTASLVRVDTREETMYQPTSPTLPFTHGNRTCKFELATFHIYFGLVYVSTLDPNVVPLPGSMAESALKMLNERGVLFFKVRGRAPEKKPYQPKFQFE